MYFWDITALKNQLKRGPLPQRSAFAYLVAILFLSYVLMETASYLPSGRITPFDGVGTAVGIGAFLIGMILAYRANGGDRGADFVSRYLALSWVIGIRLVALTLATVPVWIIVLSAIFASVPKTRDGRQTGVEIVSMLASILVAVLAARWIVSSVREVANPQAPAPTLEAGASPQPT